MIVDTVSDKILAVKFHNTVNYTQNLCSTFINLAFILHSTHAEPCRAKTLFFNLFSSYLLK
jgi:hypothetical protein